MKRLIIPVFLSLFFIADVSFGKLKPLYKPGDKLYVLAVSGLSLRQNPGVSAKKLFGISYGERLEVLKNMKPSPEFEVEGIRGLWAFAEYRGFRGYIFDGFLSRLPAPSSKGMSLEYYLENQVGRIGPPVSNLYIGMNGENTNLRVNARYEYGIEYSKSKSANEYIINLKINNIRVEEAFLILKLLKIDALKGLETFPPTNISLYTVDIENDVALEKDIRVIRNENGTDLFELHAGIKNSGYTGYILIKKSFFNTVEISISGSLY